MSIGKVLVTAAALTLGSMGAAMAADDMMNVDGLRSVGDGTLSGKHGKDVNIAQGQQSTSQSNANNSFIVDGNLTNGKSDMTNITNFGNIMVNTGNGKNMSQSIGIVLILNH